MFSKMDIVKRIVELLEKNKIPATKFAEDMKAKGKEGYNKDTVYTWKNNRSTSYMNDIEEIAEYFSVTPEYLLSGKDNSTPEDAIKILTNDMNLTDQDITYLKKTAELLKLNNNAKALNEETSGEIIPDVN